MNRAQAFTKAKMVSSLFYAKARDLHLTPEMRQIFLEEAQKYERDALAVLKELMQAV
jgi:hypothetical protein